jgi:hypothetical protein
VVVSDPLALLSLVPVLPPGSLRWSVGESVEVWLGLGLPLLSLEGLL